MLGLLQITQIFSHLYNNKSTKQQKHETTKVRNCESTKQRKYETTKVQNNIESLGVSREISLKLKYQGGVRTRDHRISKQAALSTAPGPSDAF